MADELRTPKFKIVSGGLFSNTDVFMDGEKLGNVAAASWKIDCEGVATATLEFWDVELHVVPDYPSS